MRKVLLLLVLFLTMHCCLLAQVVNQPVPGRVVPDCMYPFTISAVGTPTQLNTSYDNRPPVNSALLGGCNSWVFEYSAQNVTGLSISVQEASDATTSVANPTPGTYAAWTNAVGSTFILNNFPLTNTNAGQVLFVGYAPWIGVATTTFTGTGSVTGLLYGYHTDPSVNRNSATAIERIQDGVGTQLASVTTDSILEAILTPSTTGAVAWSQAFTSTLGATVFNIATGQHNLGGWSILNAANASCFLQIFNTTSVNVTLGATVPNIVRGLATLTGSDMSPSTALLTSAVGLSAALTTTATGNSACATTGAATFFFK